MRSEVTGGRLPSVPSERGLQSLTHRPHESMMASGPVGVRTGRGGAWWLVRSAWCFVLGSWFVPRALAQSFASSLGRSSAGGCRRVWGRHKACPHGWCWRHRQTVGAPLVGARCANATAFGQAQGPPLWFGRRRRVPCPASRIPDPEFRISNLRRPRQSVALQRRLDAVSRVQTAVGGRRPGRSWTL